MKLYYINQFLIYFEWLQLNRANPDLFKLILSWQFWFRWQFQGPLWILLVWAIVCCGHTLQAIHKIISKKMFFPSQKRLLTVVYVADQFITYSPHLLLKSNWLKSALTLFKQPGNALWKDLPHCIAPFMSLTTFTDAGTS